MPEGRLNTLRCADQDRELVAQLLNSAYADGRITLDEHTDRIAKAYDAKTFGDLTQLTTDLVAPDSSPAAPSSPQAAPVPQLPGAYRGGNSFLSTLRSGQVTLLDSEVTLNSWLGDIKLDLAAAQFVSPETQINVGGMMCDIKIRVPEGVSVDTSRVTAILSDTKISGIMPGSVRISLVGTVIMGDIKVVGPAVDNRRKYEKFIR